MNRYSRLARLAKKIKSLLIRASGARPELLTSHPTEADFHAAIGGQVWFTSLLSACGIGKVMFDAGVKPFAVVPLACFWGTVVFWLDRLLLMADPKPTRVKASTKLTLRFIFALCVAVTVSEALVQGLFHNEVKAELQFEALEAHRVNHETALQSNPELVALRNSRQEKEQELATKSHEVSFWRKEFTTEADGTAGTGHRGEGPNFEKKKANYQTAINERDQIQAELANIDERLQEKETEFRRTLDEANQNAGSPGFLANHRALLKVLSREPTGLLLYIAIALTLIILETYALLAKTGRVSVHDSIASEDVHTTTTLAERQGEITRKLVDDCTDAIKEGELTNLDDSRRPLAAKMLEHAQKHVLHQLARLRPGAETDYVQSTSAFQHIRIEHPEHGVVVAECLVDSTLREVSASLMLLRAEFEPIAAAMAKDAEAINIEGMPITQDVPLLPQIAPSYRVLFRNPQYAAGVAE